MEIQPKYPRVDENFDEIKSDEDIEKELTLPPKEGIASFLSKEEMLDIRDKIRENYELLTFYNKAKLTLSGNKNTGVHRGLLINQLHKDLQNDPAAKEFLDEFKRIVRGIIAQSK